MYIREERSKPCLCTVTPLLYTNGSGPPAGPSVVCVSPDPVTLRVLTGVRASPPCAPDRSLRTQISARLSEMDAQLLRLQSIADHIDREFANTRLVSRAEKLHSNFGLKYDLYWNLKGMISVKAFVFSPEATRGRIEQNITNARSYKAIQIQSVYLH